MTSYGYDANDNLTSESRTGLKPYTGTYTYDKTGLRKTAVVVTNGTTTHNGTYTYDGAGRLTQVVDTATSLTEAYAWNNDGSLASAPGSGYVKQFVYDEEGRLTRIQHNTGGTISAAFDYAYGADGGRRWKKDYGGSQWTWYPCGVACLAGELVEQTSDLTGATWTTAALYMRAGGGCSSTLVRRNSEYHHEDIGGNFGVTTGATGSAIDSKLFDWFGVQRYSTGSANTQWRFTGRFIEEEGLQAGSGGTGDYLPTRDQQICQQQWPPPGKGGPGKGRPGKGRPGKGRPPKKRLPKMPPGGPTIEWCLKNSPNYRFCKKCVQLVCTGMYPTDPEAYDKCEERSLLECTQDFFSP